MNSESPTQTVTLERRFAAPIELVYSAWTEAEHVVKWMKCHVDASLEVDNWIAVPGAEFRTLMKQPGVFEAHGQGRFIAVEPPALLEYVLYADPALGTPEMTVRVEFESDGEETVVTLTHSGIPDQFTSIINGGWTSSLSQLDAVVVPDAAGQATSQ
ncbi:MAG: hypothetical protein GKS06_20410 [Acidobacteria bacterium]|nr:hypothetical protein [Acidobacteriota bacterium]